MLDLELDSLSVVLVSTFPNKNPFVPRPCICCFAVELHLTGKLL